MEGVCVMRGRKPMTKKYWSAYGQLMGKQVEFGEIGVKPAVKRKKRKPEVTCPSEQDEQFVAHAWMAKMGVVHHHSPNGGYRDAREGAKFKRLGVSPGYPDFVMPYARKGHHGLYIELKRVYGGRLSDHQAWWRDFLLNEGYAWHEAKGASECIEIVSDYLDLTKGKIT